ncbi:MAG: hypothetical protein JWO55_463 [Candidatus Saccharibacteria bacterium]|jgi:hypothetical protein|nr:hypothetical protein [Candidatus Saccharibacteria bacterium]
MKFKKIFIASVAIVFVERLTRIIIRRTTGVRISPRHMKEHNYADEYIDFQWSRYRTSTRTTEIEESNITASRSRLQRRRALKQFKKIDDNWRKLLYFIYKQTEEDSAILLWLTPDQQKKVSTDHLKWVKIQDEIHLILNKHTFMRRRIVLNIVPQGVNH